MGVATLTASRVRLKGGRVSVLTLSELEEFISSRPEKNRLYLVSGKSGLGKTRFSEQLATSLGRKLVKLDSFGIKKKVDGKDVWFIKWDDALTDIGQPSKVIYEGISDNMADVQGIFEVLIVPVPSLELFRKMQAAKAKDHAAKAGLEAQQHAKTDQWTKAWLSKSKYNLEEYVKYLTGGIEMLDGKMGLQEVICVPNNTSSNVDLNNLAGWHH